MSVEDSQLRLAWATGTRVDVTPSALEIVVGDRTARVPNPPAWLVGAARALAGDGTTWDDLARLASSTNAADGALAPLRLRRALTRFAENGWLRADLRSKGRPFATMPPGICGIRLPRARSDAAAMTTPFVYARPDAGDLVLRSPASRFEVTLHHPLAAALFYALGTRRTVDELVDATGIDRACARDFVALLVAADLAEQTVDTATDEAETTEPDVVGPTWEFHDLLFHVHSRLGRLDAPAGATSRFRDVPAPPAIVRRSAASSIALPVPDFAHARATEAPFADVVEERTSLRAYGEAPITRATLGELLYRSARTRRVMTAGAMEVASRPYPSAGGLYEQEIYVVADRVGDLPRGVYAYDGVAHALVPVAEASDAMNAILASAACATGRGETPQVLLVVTARFARVAHKYEAIAYALVLKSAGALVQTFALVAHAMGLAGCPIGSGNADAFASLTHTPFFEESSVAEFALGTRDTRSERARETAV